MSRKVTEINTGRVNSGQNRCEERECPGCGVKSSYPARQECCSSACGYRMRHARSESARPAAERAFDSLCERFLGRIANLHPSVPDWTAPTRSNKKLVIPTAFLSDTHFDEYVDPVQVNNVNAYDRQIAEKRLHAFFASAIKLGKQYLAGLTYPGIVVPMGGDMFSGNIHDELRETNVASLPESIEYWLGPMMAGLQMLADSYGRVYVPCVVGNHPRGTKKPVHKGRVRDNFDWLFYRLLAKFMAGDKRVMFAISESPDFHYSVFQTRYCLTHGDQFRGGSGISGLLSPMMIGDSRKRRRSQAVRLPYDYMVMAHWHTLTQAKGVIVNGSLKGYDEYAFNNNFDYEPPQQAFWLTSVERSQIWCFTPLHVTEKDDPYSGAISAAKTTQFAPAFGTRKAA